MIASKTPTPGKEDVAINHKITVTFSKKMDTDTLTKATFFIEKSGSQIAGNVLNPTSTAATFTPDQNLDYSTTYIATVTTEMKDLSGQAIPGDSWTFTTVDAPPPGSPPDAGLDKTRPSIHQVFPEGPGVALDTVIKVTFKEGDLDPSTVRAEGPKNQLTFLIDGGAKGILGFPSANVVTFTPISKDPRKTPLKPNRDYRVEIVGGQNGVKDLAGNLLDPADLNDPENPNRVWLFTTVPLPPEPDEKEDDE